MESAETVWDGRGWREFVVINRGPAELVRLETMEGSRLYCDERHEVLCHTLNPKYKGTSFRNVLNLRPKLTRICTSFAVPLDFGRPSFDRWSWLGRPSNALEINAESRHLKEIWFMLGYHLGDGCYSHKDLSFVYGEKDLPLLDRFQQTDR